MVSPYRQLVSTSYPTLTAYAGWLRIIASFCVLAAFLAVIGGGYQSAKTASSLPIVIGLLTALALVWNAVGLMLISELVRLLIDIEANTARSGEELIAIRSLLEQGRETESEPEPD